MDCRFVSKNAKDLAKLAAALVFRHADKNKDGIITFDEFSEWYKPTFWFILSDPLGLSSHTSSRDMGGGNNNLNEPPEPPAFLAGPIVGDHDYIYDGKEPAKDRQLFFPPTPMDA